MAAAQPLSEIDHKHLLETEGFPVWDYFPGEDSEPFEYKASDWGRLNGQLVALDYSTPAFMTEDDMDQMLKAAGWR